MTAIIDPTKTSRLIEHLLMLRRLLDHTKVDISEVPPDFRDFVGAR